jgi:hypothetical protein
VEGPVTRRAGVLAVIGVTLLWLHVSNPHVGFFYGWWESKYYVRSVEHPLAPDMHPNYGYRLLPPVLVGLLPLPHEIAYQLIDYVSLAAAAYLVWAILVGEGIAPALALLCAVLFLTFPCSTRWLLAYSSGPDAVYLLALAAGYRCIQCDRLGWFALVLLVGVFIKPTLVVLWPSVLLRPPDRIRDRFVRSAVLPRLATILPALAAFILMHVLRPVPDAGVAYGKSLVNHLIMKLSYTSSMLPGVLPQVVEFPMAFFIVFGMVALVLAYHAREAVGVLRGHPPMLVFLLGSMGTSFVGSFDDARCWMYAAIPVLYVFSRVVQAHAAVYGQLRVAVPLAAAQVYLSHALPINVAAYGAYMPHDMPPAEALRWIVTWAAALVVLASVESLARPQVRR